MIPLLEWVECENCPWTLGTARIYARRALAGRRGYSHLPFLQTRKGAPIFVDAAKMERVLFKKGGKR